MAAREHSGIARRVALVGIMAASIECGKLVLAFLPNVEVVTLLIAVFGYTFGALGVLATLVFVCIEPLIWGFGTWIITYLIYWPTVAIVFALFARLKIRRIIPITISALVLTLFFGVLSSFVDVGLFTGYHDNLLDRFIIYYLRGTAFYAVQLASNAVIFPLLFSSLTKSLARIKNKGVRK